MSMKFENREGQNLSRKKLTIISQSPGEMIVDMARADTPTKEGTPITAEVFEAWDAVVEDVRGSKEHSLNAVQTANNAISVAESAQADAEEAKAASQSAVSMAEQASNAVALGTGTHVKVGGEIVQEVAFTSDPQTQINAMYPTVAYSGDLNNLRQPYFGGYTTGTANKPTGEDGWIICMRFNEGYYRQIAFTGSEVEKMYMRQSKDAGGGAWTPWTALIDETNAQTISGVKQFSNGVKIGNNWSVSQNGSELRFTFG